MTSRSQARACWEMVIKDLFDSHFILEKQIVSGVFDFLIKETDINYIILVIVIPKRGLFCEVHAQTSI